MLTHRFRKARAGLQSRRAVAAMEFGILAPVMATLVVGTFDLAKAGILWEQVWSSARSIAESASTLALQPDGSTSLNYTQAQQALSIVFAEMPWLRAGIATGAPSAGQVPANTISAVLTSVSYQPSVSTCTSSCTYVAVVKWSKAYSGNNFITQSSVLRPCVTLTQTSPTAAQSLTTVPTLDVQTAYKSNSNNMPDPFLIADVTFTYTPYFFRFITGSVTFTATAYWTVRSTAANSTSTWTSYSATSDTAAQICS